MSQVTRLNESASDIGAVTNVKGNDGVQVNPDGSGTIQFIGVVVDNGENPTPVYFESGGSNIENLDVQLATTSTFAARNINNAGLSSYSSADFVIDSATGIVRLAGGRGVGSIDVIGLDVAITPIDADNTGEAFLKGGTLLTTGTTASGVQTRGSDANTARIDLQYAGSNAASSTANNFGVAQFDANQFTVTSGFVQVSSIATLDLHVAKRIVNSTANAGGNYTTITAAMAASSAGDTIFVMPGATGIYTEDVLMTPGVNLVSFTADAYTPNVTIVGKISMSGAGSCSISGIRLQTNSDFFLAVTGSAASTITLKNCFLNASNNTGISFTSSSASSQINIFVCNGDLGTTGIAMFSMSSIGLLKFDHSEWLNTGLSSTASTQSAGQILAHYTRFFSPVTTSGTAAIGVNTCQFAGASVNTTGITIGGSGSNVIDRSRITAGSAPAISVSTLANLELCTILSSNTNAISGVGQIKYSSLSFESSSSLINTTTQTPLVFNPGAETTISPAGDYTLVNSDRVVFADSSAARAITLSAAPVTGQKHTIADITGTAATNNITVSGNGKNILGATSAATYVINNNGGSIDLIYSGTLWKIV